MTLYYSCINVFCSRFATVNMVSMINQIKKYASCFQNELARKITALRGDDSDEGLPSSPPTHSSIADVFSNGLKVTVVL